MVLSIVFKPLIMPHSLDISKQICFSCPGAEIPPPMIQGKAETYALRPPSNPQESTLAQDSPDVPDKDTLTVKSPAQTSNGW